MRRHFPINSEGTLHRTTTQMELDLSSIDAMLSVNNEQISWAV